MHLFAAIVAAGITLYLLRNAWERLQERRELRRVERALNPQQSPQTASSPWPFIAGAITVMLIVAALTFPH